MVCPNNPIDERPDASWTCERIGSWVLEASEMAVARELLETVGELTLLALLEQNDAFDVDGSR